MNFEDAQIILYKYLQVFLMWGKLCVCVRARVHMRVCMCMCVHWAFVITYQQPVTHLIFALFLEQI